MAATLGSTTDPKELIPGDVGKLGNLETAVNSWSDNARLWGDFSRINARGAVRDAGHHGAAAQAGPEIEFLYCVTNLW